MRKSLIIGITAAVIGAGALSTGLAVANDGWERCGDRKEARYDESRGGNKGMRKGGEERFGGKRQMAAMAEKLELTDEQRDEMKQLMRSQRNGVFSQRDAMHDLREDLRDLDVSAADYDQQVAALADKAENQAAEMIRMKAEQKRAMFNILTPEQQQKFLELKR